MHSPLLKDPMRRLRRRFGRQRDKKRERLMFIGGAGLGGALMYLLDPERGNRRRGLLRDQMSSAIHQSEDAIGKTSEDVWNRTRGMLATAQARVGGTATPDPVLVQRVRSAMGRVVSHPRAVEVSANQGQVMLRGYILAHELDRLLAKVRAVRGVIDIESRVQTHKQAGDIPDLQGGKPRSGQRPDILQVTWAPATRLLAGLIGSGMGVLGARRRDVPGMVLSAVGLGLLARGATNKEMKRIIGVGGGRRAIDIQKTINVSASPEEVYAFWSNFENFPRFMSHLREVRDLGEGRSRWRVDGPAGLPVEWQALITRAIPNQILAWKSVPGSLIANAGIIHFERTADGGTRLDIKLSYNPPAGAAGHAFAALFGADARTAMDDDLLRFKSLMETGKATGHEQQVSREDALGDGHQRSSGTRGSRDSGGNLH